MSHGTWIIVSGSWVASRGCGVAVARQGRESFCGLIDQADEDKALKTTGFVTLCVAKCLCSRDTCSCRNGLGGRDAAPLARDVAACAKATPREVGEKSTGVRG